MKVRRLAFSISVIAAVVAAFTVSPVSAASSRHVFPGTAPSWTAGKGGTAMAGGQRLTAYVWLTVRNAAQRDALAAAVSDPSSASYGQFLTQAQYQAQFAPTSAQVSDVSSWLRGSGLHVDAVGAGNAYLLVSGTATAINTAFGTQITNYVVNGKQEHAPARDLSVPDSVAAEVQAVLGLATLGHRTSPAFAPPSGFVNAPPCSAGYYGQKSTAGDLPAFQGSQLPYAVCGYTPTNFRSVYGVTQSGRTGAGQTVAITDAYDSIRLQSDADTYAGRHGDQPFASGQFSDLSVPEDASTGSVCGGNGWYGEQNLDVEAVHGMAKAANVLYYGAASCYDSDLLAQLNQVVQDNRASLVTNSWGEPTFVGNGFYGCTQTVCETIDQSLINAYESVFKQGATQGIGFYFSSGDSGDELKSSGYKHPDWPTGDPWVTSVGGTSLAVNSSGARGFETGWGTEQYRLDSTGTKWNLNNAFQYGAGGGYSQIFGEPGYQKGVVTGDTTHGRAVPDISMDGDPTTGMLIGITQLFTVDTVFGQGTKYGEYRIGGTSLSSPLFAGLQADTQQGHGRIGFANPRIYSLFGKGVYFDVTPQGDAGNVRVDYLNGENAANGTRPSVRTFDQDSSLVTGSGWDDVTGVGSATAAYILEAFSTKH